MDRALPYAYSPSETRTLFSLEPATKSDGQSSYTGAKSAKSTKYDTRIPAEKQRSLEKENQALYDRCRVLDEELELKNVAISNLQQEVSHLRDREGSREKHIAHIEKSWGEDERQRSEESRLSRLRTGGATSDPLSPPISPTNILIRGNYYEKWFKSDGLVRRLEGENQRLLAYITELESRFDVSQEYDQTASAPRSRTTTASSVAAASVHQPSPQLCTDLAAELGRYDWTEHHTAELEALSQARETIDRQSREYAQALEQLQTAVDQAEQKMQTQAAAHRQEVARLHEELSKAQTSAEEYRMMRDKENATLSKTKRARDEEKSMHEEAISKLKSELTDSNATKAELQLQLDDAIRARREDHNAHTNTLSEAQSKLRLVENDFNIAKGRMKQLSETLQESEKANVHHSEEVNGLRSEHWDETSTQIRELVDMLSEQWRSHEELHLQLEHERSAFAKRSTPTRRRCRLRQALKLILFVLLFSFICDRWAMTFEDRGICYRIASNFGKPTDYLRQYMNIRHGWKDPSLANVLGWYFELVVLKLFGPPAVPARVMF